MLHVRFDTLLTPLSIDISTGDAITPHAVRYNFSEIFDNEKTYELWGYTSQGHKVNREVTRRYGARNQQETQRFPADFLLEEHFLKDIIPKQRSRPCSFDEYKERPA